MWNRSRCPVFSLIYRLNWIESCCERLPKTPGTDIRVGQNWPPTSAPSPPMTILSQKPPDSSLASWSRTDLQSDRSPPAQLSPGALSGRSRWRDRKSTRLNSSHVEISYAVFCLKKKKKKI